jgi:hypothetical protein
MGKSRLTLEFTAAQAAQNSDFSSILGNTVFTAAQAQFGS